MEKNKVDLAAVAAEAGKNAKAFWSKTKDAIVSIADQNDDGSLDFKDVSVIAESIGNAAKNAAVSALSSAEEKSRDLEKKMLLPILAGFFLITAPYWIAFAHREIETRTMWKEITEYVLENKDQIEVTEKRQIFPYAYTGLAIAGVEYGYYYDAEDRFKMKDEPYRNGYRTDGYPDDPTDWYYTERICENWFYYEVHDG